MSNANLLTVVRSLRFARDRRDELLAIEPPKWPELLKLTDRAQLTLPLGLRCREFLPDPVRTRIDGNLANNRLRYERLLEEYRLIAGILQAKSIDHVVLKGLAQVAPFYVEDPFSRPQYDIDLYCPQDRLATAFEALRESGYVPARPQSGHTDHLPAMLRDQNWKWTGDYYHPDLPLTVELHFRFWDPDTEKISVPHLDTFWSRRTRHITHGVTIPILALSDGISYSALHLVRHLLRGDLRAYHAYELAYFLNHTASDDHLWSEYCDNRNGRPHLIDTVAFCLAEKWFACKVHPVIREAIDRLPSNVRHWFDIFCWSPLANKQSTKDEIFLHLSLVQDNLDRCRILRRRLFPFHGLQPRTQPRSHSGSFFHRALAILSQTTRFLTSRSMHHLRTVISLVPGFLRWRFSRRSDVAF